MRIAAFSGVSTSHVVVETPRCVCGCISDAKVQSNSLRIVNADAELLQLDDTFRRALPELGTDWQADAAPDPTLVAFNAELAGELGLDPTSLTSPVGVSKLLGAVPGSVKHFAMGYAGHQFGNFSPRLGDGRALLLGELLDANGHRFDVHLKGSGRTSFSRGGDGKAALGPMLREFLIAGAMDALGIPTTRSLAVIATGENIRREGIQPGAVLVRIAASHIRVGTFEYAARLADQSVLSRLADYSIERHYPEAAQAPNRYLAFLDSVVDAQAQLIAKWMQVGFIHGVMNTDNMTISGETIDYGPCAFMEHYDPRTVFSSIDHGGRYAFGNQPTIAQWNLARFAETLLSLIDEDPNKAVELATATLTTFQERFQRYWSLGMRAKLGLDSQEDDDQTLVTDLLDSMLSSGSDYTAMFRALAASLGTDGGSTLLPATDEAFAVWYGTWRARLAREDRPLTEIAEAMNKINPLYIPRNHLVEDALGQATNGDTGPFQRLLAAVTQPYLERPGMDEFATGASGSFTATYQTFCGT
jgi:serine/tyrosine/threonine adenylyltransferase